MRLFGRAKRIKALEAEIEQLKRSHQKSLNGLTLEMSELKKQKSAAEERFQNLASQKSDYGRAWKRAHDFIERKGYKVEYAYATGNNALTDVTYSGKSRLEQKLSEEVEQLKKKVPNRCGSTGRFIKK